MERPRVDDPWGGRHPAQGERARGCLPRAGSSESGLTVLRMRTYDDGDFDPDEARARDRGRDPRRRGRRHLPGLPHRRHLARVRRLPRAAARRHLRARGHEARALREAAARHPALLLRRAARADPGDGCRSTSTSSSARASARRSGRPSSSRSSGGRASGCSPRIDGARPRAATYPWPVDHCGICDFRQLCRQKLADDDHLVARRRARAAVRGAARPGRHHDAHAARRDRARHSSRPHPPRDLRAAAEPGRAPAPLQPHRRAPRRAPPGRGGSRLPAAPATLARATSGSTSRATRSTRPARGLEYLFGWCYREDGEERYEVVWGLDREGEKAAFERFVDWVEERRRRYPDLHVYHYAAYERTALRRLMGEHSTREDEIDDWLRRRAARRPLPRREAARCAPASRATRSRRSRSCTGSRARPRWRAATSRSSSSRVARARRPRRCSRGSARTTRRTAARRSSSTSGCSSSGPTALDVARAAGPARADGGGRGARRRAGGAARGAARGRRGGRARAGFSRTSSTTTSARGSRSGGSGSTTSRSTRTSCSTTPTRSAGSSSSASRSRTGSRSSTRSRSRRRSTRSSGALCRSGHRDGVPRRRSTTSAASSRSGAGRRARTSRFHARSSLRGRSPTGSTATRSRAFARAYLDGSGGGPRLGDPRAAAAARAARPARARGARSRSTAATSSCRARRVGQDVAGREGGDRAHARGAAGRRHVAQPQGDRQPAARDRGRGDAAGVRVSRAARSRPATRTRASRATSSTERQQCGDCSTTSTSSSRARRGSSRAPGARRAPRHADRRRGRPGLARRRRRDRARARATSSSSATRTSSRRSRRARMPDEAKASVLQHLLGDDDDGAAGPRDLPRAARGGCGRSSPRSPPRRTTRAGSSSRAVDRAANASRPGTGSSCRPVAHAANGQLSREEADEVAARDCGAARHRLHRRRRRHAAAHA